MLFATNWTVEVMIFKAWTALVYTVCWTHWKRLWECVCVSSTLCCDLHFSGKQCWCSEQVCVKDQLTVVRCNWVWCTCFEFWELEYSQQVIIQSPRDFSKHSHQSLNPLFRHVFKDRFDSSSSYLLVVSCQIYFIFAWLQVQHCTTSCFLLSHLPTLKRSGKLSYLSDCKQLWHFCEKSLLRG